MPSLRWETFKDTHADLVDFVTFAGSIGGILAVVLALVPGSPLVYLLAASTTIRSLVGAYTYYVLVGISILAWVILFLLAVRYAASKHQLHAATKSIAETIQHNEVADKRIITLTTELDELRTRYEYTMITSSLIHERFLELALANADCDKSMFDIFLADLAVTPMPAYSLQSVEFNIEKNIERILADARYIFNQHTGGRPCAICVKVIEDPPDPDTSPFEFRVSTQWRDPITARSNRTLGDNVRYTLVRGNTPDEVLFTAVGDRYHDDVWARDNLRELERCGVYRNSRNYHDDFNATVVAGIHNLELRKRVQWRGFFCVDNKHGGLENEPSKYYAREFAARISVMIYRWKMLREHRGVPWIKSAMTTRVSKE